MNLTVFKQREARFHIALILLFLAFCAFGQPPAQKPDKWIPVNVGNEPQGWVRVIADTSAWEKMTDRLGWNWGDTSGSEMQTEAAAQRFVLVSAVVSSGWGSRERVVSIAFWTAAFSPLTQLPTDPPGPGEDQRLINDLIANLSKAGLMKGVDLSKPGNFVQILGWAFPPANMVTDSRKMRATPKK